MESLFCPLDLDGCRSAERAAQSSTDAIDADKVEHRRDAFRGHGRETLSPRIRGSIMTLACISTAAWTLVIAILSLRSESLNEYWYLTIPRISTAVRTGVLAPIAYTPSWEGFVVEMAVLTGLPVSEVILIPMGAAVIPLSLYVLSKSAGLPRIAAILLVGFDAIDVARASSTYSLFAHAVSYPLVFLFISAAVNYSRRAEQRIRWSIVMVALLVGLHFLYYSAELLALVFVVGYTFFGSWMQRNGRGTRTRTPRNLTLAFVALFFAFNEIIYQQFLPNLSGIPPQEGIDWIAGRLGGIFGGYQTTGQAFGGSAPQSAFVSSLVVSQIVIIATPLALLLLSHALALLRRRPSRISLEAANRVVVWSLLLASVVDFITYFLLGFVNLRTILLLLPFAAYFCLTAMATRPRVRHRGLIRHLPTLFLAFLLITAVAKNADLLLTTPAQPGSSSAQVTPGARWLQGLGQGVLILTDLNTATRISLAPSFPSQGVEFESYNSSLYFQVLDSAPFVAAQFPSRYLVVDLNAISVPIDGTGWRTYQPLSGYYDLVQHNSNLDLVYDDHNLEIFAFR